MARGVRVTPEAGTQKWVSRLSGATADVTAGVNAVTESPGQAAVKQADAYLAGIQAAFEKWKRNTSRVTVDQWKTAMINIGIPRIASGAQQKQGKMAAFAAEFYPHLDRGMAQIAAMPKTTYEQRVQRAVQMMAHNHNFKRGA